MDIKTVCMTSLLLLISSSRGVISSSSGSGSASGSIPLRIETHPRDQLAENGDIVTFFCNATGDPPIMYQWFHNNDTISLFVSNATILEVTALYDDFGSYHCNATSGNEEVASNSATLTVSPFGSANISMSQVLTNFGSNVSRTCSAEGGPNNTFEWTNDQGVVSNSSQLQLTSITASDAGTYTCTVTNAAGSSNASATVFVAPYNLTIIETVDNDNITYACIAEGGPGNIYEWLRLRDNATVSMTQELTLDSTDPLDGGDYQCTITNTAGNISAMTTLNVGTVIVTSPQTQNVTAGELFTLTCNATGYPVPSIEWTLNGTSYIIEDSSITTITLTEELRSNTSNLTVTSAMTNDTGIYECVATNVLNNDTQDANVTVQDCPDEPINVQIFNVNSRNLTINWTEPHNNNDPITQYNISYQNPDCLVDANNVTQNVTITSVEGPVMINDLHPGEYYTFTIIAINSICPSQPSLPASVRTLEEVPGAAPVVFTNASPQSINVTWMMLECQDRRGNITMYEVRYTSTAFWDSVNQTLNTSSGNELSLEVGGLEEFLNYTIEVRAYTAIGPGPYSISMDVQTLPDIPSESVTNLNPVNVTPTSIELSWGPVNERAQNGIILSYRIYYRLIFDDSYNMINVTTRNRNISDLMENEVYVFAVTAVNQVGESMVNASVMVQTNESAPSTPPVNVMISNVTDGDDIAVNITWDPPTDPNGIIQYYRVKFAEASDPLDNGPGNTNCPPLDNTTMNMFANITSGSSGAPTNTNLSRLDAYRMYNYSIFAATSVGEGPSADGSFLTREDTPLAPENLTVNIPGVARNSTTLLVNWERPLCDQGVLSGYELCYVESSVGDCDSNGTTVNITDPDQLSYTINDLSINTNYIVVLRGRTGAGLGDPASANGTTDEDAPDPVMNIVTQFSPNNTIRGYYNITWTPPAPTNGSFYQTLNYSYSSAYSVGPTYDGAFNITLNQSQDYFIFEALYYTDYSFNITTSNMKYAIDNGPARFSNQSSPAAPTAVRDIRVAMSTPVSIYITWDHPEYPNSQLLNYTFYYNDNPAMLQSGSEISADGFKNVTLETMTSFNLTGLLPFTNYTILITVTGRDVGSAPFAMELLHRTNATVLPNTTLVLPTTEVPLPEPDTDTITVLLPQPEQIMTGIVEVYAVIVVTGDELRAPRARRNTDDQQRSPREIIRENGDRLPGPYNSANNTELYSAAVWTNPADVPDIFVVGSETTTRGPDGTLYVNAELAEGTEYGVFNYIRLESDDGDEGPLIVSSEYIAVESTTDNQEDDDDDDNDDNDVGLAVGVAIAAVVIVLVVVIGIGIIAYHHWQRNHKNGYYNGEVAYTGSDGVVQNKAYAPSRQYQVEFKAASTQDVSKIDVNPLVDPDGDQDHPHGDQDHPDADSNDAYHPDDDGHEETEFNN